MTPPPPPPVYAWLEDPPLVASLAEEVAALRVATDRHAAAADRLQAAIARDRRAARPPAPVVVVLEDHDAVRAAVVDALTRALPVGVTVIACTTAAEAKAALRGRPAVILADYYLGAGETSRDLLAHRDVAVRALLYSGSVDMEALRAVAEDTGSLVVSKPVSPEGWDRLAGHVRHALAISGALRRASR